MSTFERYVIGTWVRTKDAEGGTLNVMSLSLDHPGLLQLSDATDQSGGLIGNGHQCIFRVTCSESQLAALEADKRYTVFPVEGEATLSEKLLLKQHDGRIDTLPAGTTREQMKSILVEKFRLQGLEQLADQDLARAIAAEERRIQRFKERRLLSLSEVPGIDDDSPNA